MNTKRRIERVAAVAATLALSACSTPTEGLSIAVTGRQRFEPLGEYRGWWETVEACSSRSGDFDRVRWYEADEMVIRGKSVLGFWEPPHDITISNALKEEASIVRHEMLHDLLTGDVEHEQGAWSACGLDRPDGGS